MSSTDGEKGEGHKTIFKKEDTNDSRWLRLLAHFESSQLALDERLLLART